MFLPAFKFLHESEAMPVNLRYINYISLINKFEYLNLHYFFHNYREKNLILIDNH